MICTVSDWKKAWGDIGLPTSAIPDHPDYGLRYPWRMLIQRALSSEHRRKVATAKARITTAIEQFPDIQLGWSAGKDSTALACLLSSMGLPIPAFGEKDDLDYPAEKDYLTLVGNRLNIQATILEPTVSLHGFLKESGASLVNDLHGKTAELSSKHFYDLLDAHRKKAGYSAVMLGLRSDESRGRKMNRRVHGHLYTRSDGLSIATPICDWEDIDVHTYIASQNIPILPVYLCIDVGMDPLKIRKSWFVAGGMAASIFGHYVWLRRWWPDLWERIADLDPDVRRLS